MEGQQLKELCHATGGACGGTCVDDKFLDLLRTVFGDAIIREFRIEDPESFLLLMRSFESAKRKVQLGTTHRISLQLPVVPLSKFCQKYHQKDVEDVIKSSSLNNVVTFRNGHLKIEAGHFKSLFSTSIEQLTTVLNTLFKDARIAEVKDIILVGGFAECEIIQQCIKSSFPSRRVIIPEDCGLAVLKGAVMYGHKPTYIAVRIIKSTYGVSIAKPFDPALHDQDHVFVHNDKRYSKDLFDKIIEMNTEVTIGSKTIKTFYTTRPFQQYLNMPLYISKSKNPTYVDEDDCDLVDTITIPVKNPTKSKQEVKVSFSFGHTEIIIGSVDELNEKYEGSLDQLGSTDRAWQSNDENGFPDVLIIE